MPDLREAAHCLLRGFAAAHLKITEGKNDPSEAGTTTLLGGAILELAEPDRTHEFKVDFVFFSFFFVV
jgi:hypothetical protein